MSAFEVDIEHASGRKFSDNEQPWIISTPEKLGEFVRGLVTDAVDVGGRITIDVLAVRLACEEKNEG